ncbi:MAG: hypothetical protein II075_06970, partial [Bacteroidales bacterium]|nr:hypothetical protein [Bacteroidales bacterium]
MSPEFVKNNGVIADHNYIEWLSDVKRRFKSSQIKAAVRVNTEMLSFYWSIGRDLVTLSAESKWGSGFFNQLSLDLKNAFPDETGFSVTNLKYMKRWYLFYYKEVIIRHQLGDEFRQRFVDDLTTDEKGQQVADLFKNNEKGHQLGDLSQ